MRKPENRYAVLVWFHDHWGVTWEGNDLDAAEEVRRKATEKVPTILLDTDDYEFSGRTTEVTE